MKRVLLTLLLLGALLPVAGAQKQKVLEEQIAAYEKVLAEREAALSTLAAQLSDTNTKLDAQLAERDRLGEKIVALSNHQSRIRTQTARLRTQQRASAKRITRLSAQADGLKGQLQDLLVNLHKRRSGRFFGALTQSESLFKLRVRNYYLGQLTNQDVALLETFNTTTEALRQARAQRTGQVQALGQQSRALKANAQALKTAQANLEGVIAELSGSRAGQLAQREALLTEQNRVEARLTGARGSLAAELERLREAAARQAQLAEAQPERPKDDTFATEASRLERLIRGLDTPAPTNEQDFAEPFPGAVVVRPYGQDGATDVWLRAQQPGTAVRAVRSGLVYRASVITANSGFTVAVRHADGLISAYTNLQVPVVKLGDRVEQGDIIGYLGGGIIAPDILQLRIGRSEGFDLVYQDPAPLLGLQ